MVKVYSDFDVYLESLTIGDADSIAENANDQDVARGVGMSHFPHPYSRSDALAFIEYATIMFAQGKEAHFGIRLGDGTLVGVLGINRLDHENKRCEIGYWIGKRYWRNGYGRDAVRLLLRFGFESLSLNRIEAIVFAFNDASKKLLLGLGFESEGVMKEYAAEGDAYVDGELFAMLRRNYKDTAKTVVEGFEAALFGQKRE